MKNQTLLFLKEGLTRSRETGSICATSPFAGEALTDPLIKSTRKSSMNIIEVGTGTGSVTKVLLSRMQRDDKLVLCEINQKFMNILKKNLSVNEDYSNYKDNITFFGSAIQEYPENTKFDLIVCALPFLNFELETVREIFAKFKRLSHKDTLITYYEYIGLRKLGMSMPIKERQERFLDFDKYFAEFIRPAIVARKREWRNVLPINIYTIKTAMLV